MPKAQDNFEDLLEPFLRAIAHDLKGGLAIIKGNAYLLSKIETCNISDEGAQLIHDIDKKVNEMADNIDKLYEYATLANSYSPTIETKPVNQVLQSAWNSLELNSCKLHIDSVTFPVTTDIYCLELILDELFCNAFQFRHPQRACKIDVGVTKNNDQVDIIITDNGRGMSKRELDDAFIPFRKASDSKGAGMGLAIASRRAQLLQGEIRILNSTEDGTKILLSIKQNLTPGA